MEREDSIKDIFSAKYLKLAKKMMFFSTSVYTARSVRKNNSQEEDTHWSWSKVTS